MLIKARNFAHLHPYQSDDTVQAAMLELLYQCQQILAEIAGLPAVSLQPAAGAQGELTALLVAAAYFRDKKIPKSVVLIPDGAHGTNPASARDGRLFATVPVKEHRQRPGLPRQPDTRAAGRAAWP